jgi:zinc/manganese transport system substrate-binding protein
MRTNRTAPAIAMVAAISLVLAACGSDGGDSAGSEAGQQQGAPAADGAAGLADDAALPTIVVTTNILGDVVQAVVGDAAEVVTIMPVGADPHDFQASAQEVVAMNSADALIVNGADFEEGLLDVIDAAGDEGVPTFDAISAVDTIEFGEGGHDEHSDDEHSDDEHSDDEHSDDEHSDDEHSDDEHSDDEEHDEHSGADPHFFTDPMRMATVVEALVEFLQEELTFADPAAVSASAAAYVAELVALDGEVAALVASIPEERRVLVTNHEVFGYFADRYGFEVVGAVVPSGSTTDGVSAGELAELAEKIVEEGVPAIFADVSSSDDLIEALAAEVGDVIIVELYSESLGESGSDGATYMEMIRTNATRMSSALA